MNNLFVPYEIAELANKNGFNESCLMVWSRSHSLFTDGPKDGIPELINHDTKVDQIRNDLEYLYTNAPLYQQLVDWFREKHFIIVEARNCEYSCNKFKESKNPAFKFKDHVFNFDSGESYTDKYNDYYSAFNKAFEKAFELI